MNTPTAPSTLSLPPPRPADSTLGARLAAASRKAQGLPSTVSDPVVLAELRGLCTAPRPTKRAVAVTRRGPAR
ncbi:hypothetical protein [Propionibacterium freudenreichii]|uniref:hypothetical protein n=1 Tax=Propionibacterium freudenreichii TaxID=1744 RepID=UPI0012FE1832|nr:hypothetical protein [Propionibacterium freudenreichii]MDK9347599.1 hypothetical protein [Propionibacterium freudenreichii]MDK9642796.1 hypothetical protein [Propionibacterium freudenreichii]